MSASYRACLRAITLASSVAMLAAPALAQSATPVVPAPASPGASAPRSQSASVNPLTLQDVSKLKGVDVYGSDNQKIGQISTALMNPETKTIDRLVVGEGGVLGVGAHDVALPISAFSWDAQNGSFKIARTGDELKSMPEWHEQQVSEAPSGNADRETRTPGGGVAPGAAAPAPAPATGGVGR